jgi:hypothetical protein
MTLRGGYIAVAMKLQEAADLSIGQVWCSLVDNLNDQCRGTGKWCHLVEVLDDGHCVYASDGGLKRAPYGESKVDMAAAVDVVPVTSYKEAAKVEPTALQLTESASTIDVIKLTEARADYEIKLIAPGRGSSAFYPAEVLKRDGPNVFKSGTHVYLNHPTAAEESQRPEGDVSNLAGVLTTTAAYHESHSKGPGLYARMKVFQDHAALVEEKAAHVGMSIRASGVAEAGRMKEGVPVLKQLTGAESVDVVTRAGAGGMILTEAAKPAKSNIGGSPEMDAAEVQKLIEAAVKTAQAPLIERAIRGDAREEATRLLKTVSLHEAAKEMVVDNVLRNIPQKDSALDTVVFGESVAAESKRIGALLAAATGSGQVRGMGAAPVIDTKESERLAERAKSDEEEAIRIFESLGMEPAAAKFAAKGRAQ